MLHIISTGPAANWSKKDRIMAIRVSSLIEACLRSEAKDTGQTVSELGCSILTAHCAAKQRKPGKRTHRASLALKAAAHLAEEAESDGVIDPSEAVGIQRDIVEAETLIWARPRAEKKGAA